ncbi:glycosyl hydrolase family 28-related protein [Kitasatospora gansuensis]
MLIAAGAALGVVGAVGSGGTAAAAGPGGPVFDVRAYGAVGDGVANDTAAFKAAFTAAAATKRPATVLIPPGTYLVAAGQRLTQGMTVSAYGAYIRRTANCGALLKNFVSKRRRGRRRRRARSPTGSSAGTRATATSRCSAAPGTWRAGPTRPRATRSASRTPTASWCRTA